jgi:microcystin degradation protein MlrC
VLEAAVFAGFPYAGHADNGMSGCVSVEAEAAGVAQAFAERLASLASEKGAAAAPSEVPLAAIVERIRRSPTGVVVVAEPADNIGGGAYGDGTGLLRALIDADVGGESFVAICDPAAVAALADAPSGARRRLAIGGRGFRGDPGPLEREWTLVSRSDGDFALENPRSPLAAFHGQTVRMGPCAVVACGAVRVLLTSRPTAPWDLGQWRSQGLEPKRARVIGVKAAAAHRLAYQPIAAAWLSVDAPGPCPSDLTRLRR